VQRARQRLLQQRMSKYIHAPELPVNTLRLHDTCRVLVVDQTAGDMSVALGAASAETFSAMLQAALTENPGATVYVKTHPEVSAGRKGGYLTDVQEDARVVLLRMPVNPLSLIEQMDRVYVASSTMGFEALLAGKPVVCFGVPWYAGWGVTDDRCTQSPAWARRQRRRRVDELFAAAYMHYTRYLDPVTHQRGCIQDVMDWLVRQKDMARQMHGPGHKGRVLGVGFRRWKAAHLKPLLGLHPGLVDFVPHVRALQRRALGEGDTVVCWGASPPAGLSAHVGACGARLLHMEDGFVRSVGLGSDLIRPLSLVLDRRGIYFDATRVSDLEHLLLHRAFTAADVQRARAVRAFVVANGITKYNLEPRQAVQWPSGGKQVVLVPGQVEDDASIRLGCTSVRTNLDLLRAVRVARPDAFIVYKPHPDVQGRNRRGRVARQAVLRWADHVEAGVSVVSCIEACDEVHTMTSLSGFDALLRGKTVVTYGQPFYAGWGLTQDRALNAPALARRQRALSIDELVAGALLHYPIYWDWDLKGYTTCEAVLHRIVEQRGALEASGGLERLRVGFVRRQFRKLAVLVKAWRGRG
ncbi:MAG: capsular polysaccharide biosynthesis protein, partial [Hydrogenophaga sp.]